MSNLSNDELLKAASSARFVALSQLDATVTDFHNWDTLLVRESRLLVPVDVNALVVRAGDEAMIRLPFRRRTGDPPTPDDPAQHAHPGVHLMWTVPATFGRGTIVTDPSPPTIRRAARCTYDPCPTDGWCCDSLFRSAPPTSCAAGCCDAADGSVTPFSDYPKSECNDRERWPSSTRRPGQRPRRRPRMDEVLRRRTGSAGDLRPTRRPRRVAPERHRRRLADLRGRWMVGSGRERSTRWCRVDLRLCRSAPPARLGRPRSPRAGRQAVARRELESQGGTHVQLEAATRYATSSPAQVDYQPSRSGFVTAGTKVATLLDAPTRTTLLHGRIHGVPWQGAAPPDDRPPVSAVASGFRAYFALGVGAAGQWGDGAGDDTPTSKPTPSACSAAFQSGLLARISEPDVWPEIDNYEHLQGFGSLPGGIEAIDRFRELQRSTTDPGSGSRLGRRSKIQYEVLTVDSALLWSTQKYFIATPQSKAAASSRVPTSPVREESQHAVQAPGVRTAAPPGGAVQLSGVSGVGDQRRRSAHTCRRTRRGRWSAARPHRRSDRPGSDGKVTGRDLLASVGSWSASRRVAVVGSGGTDG